MANVASLAAEITADASDFNGELKIAAQTINKLSAQTRAASKRMDASFKRMGAMSGRTRFAMANLGNQVQDVIVQIQGGTSAARAFSQQLPQATAMMGPLGVAFGTASALLIPLAANFLTSSANARKLTEAMAALREQTDSANASYRQFALGIASGEELRVTDAVAQKRAEIARLEEQVSKTFRPESLKLAQEALRVAQGELAELEKTLSQRKASHQQVQAITQGVVETTDAERLLGEQMLVTARNAAVVAFEVERTRNAAMEAAREFVKMQELRSRFAGEDLLMSQPVGRVGAGEPPPAIAPAVQGISGMQERIKEMTSTTQGELQTQSQAWSKFSNDLQGTLSQGGDRALAISKKFAAAQALISTFQGAAKALTLPFPQNLAAYAQTLATGYGAVKGIQGVTAGGGGGGGAAQAAAAPAYSQAVAITLNGSENATFSMAQVRGLITQINEAVEGGARIRLV